MRFNEYQKGALSTFIGHRDPHTDVARIALGVSGEAGEVAEVAKKYLRGDYEYTEFRDRLEGELGDLLWYISVAAHLADVSLEEVARLNLSKLSSRKERGVLQGDGSDR